MSERTLRLSALHIARAPGIARGFDVDELAGGLNVVFGPNESGKTTLCNAVMASLWPSTRVGSPWSVRARFEDGEAAWEASVEDERVLWRRGGREQAPPKLPPDALAPCFVLGVEALLGKSETDAELAARIARSLTGGFDLPAARIESKLGEGGKEKRALEEARREEREVREEQRDLRVHETRLGDLERERTLARTEAGRVGLLEKALELAQLRANAAQRESDLTRFPPGLERWRGDELEQHDKLARARQTAQSALQKAADSASAARAELAKLPLAHGSVSDAALREQLDRSRELDRADNEIAGAEKERAAAAGRVRAARVALGDGEREPVSVDFAEIDALSRERTAVDGQLAGVEKALELFQRAAEESRTSESGGASPVSSRLRVLAIAGGALLAVAGVLLGLSVSPAGWLLSALGVVISVVAIVARASSAADPLAVWSQPTVSEREQLAAKKRALDERALALRNELGIDPGIEASVLAARARAHAEARDAEAAANAVLEHLAEPRAERLRLLRAFLAEHDVTPSDDATGVRTALEDLRDWSKRAVDAQAALDRAIDDERKARARLDEIEQQWIDLGQLCGVDPDDRARLQTRAASLAEFRKLRADVEQDARRMTQLERELDSDRDLIAAGESELAERLEAAQAARHRVEELAAEIARIQGEIEAARHGDELESLGAAVREAQLALLAKRDEALQRASVNFLLDAVERELSHGEKSPVLERAQQWFAQFTGLRHKLVVVGAGRAGAPEFRGHDTQRGEDVAISALSAGTRAQLVIAARLAFAAEECAAAGLRLPLFLDEALATSDDERFPAVVKAVLTLVREGWQVFYLTSNWTDARRWVKQATEAGDVPCMLIDLAERRALPARIRDAAELELPVRERVPAPGGMNPQQYAVALRVDAFDPSLDPGAVHVFHLLRDDLELLHRIAELGHVRAGQLEAWLATAEARHFVEEPARERLRARLHVLRRFNEAWRIGRGRPVDRNVLIAAGVSSLKLDEVAQLAQRVEHDARTLIQRMRAGGVPRYQEKKTDELRDFLVSNGYLDERDVLDHDGVVRHVLSESEDDLRSEALTADAARELVHAWWHSSRASKAPTR